jgi:hypothetical protein
MRPSYLALATSSILLAALVAPSASAARLLEPVTPILAEAIIALVNDLHDIGVGAGSDLNAAIIGVQVAIEGLPAATQPLVDSAPATVTSASDAANGALAAAIIGGQGAAQAIQAAESEASTDPADALRIAQGFEQRAAERTIALEGTALLPLPGVVASLAPPTPVIPTTDFGTVVIGLQGQTEDFVLNIANTPPTPEPVVAAAVVYAEGLTASAGEAGDVTGAYLGDVAAGGDGYVGETLADAAATGAALVALV